MNALDKYNLSFSISSGNEIPRHMKPTQLCSIFTDSHDTAAAAESYRDSGQAPR